MSAATRRSLVRNLTTRVYSWLPTQGRRNLVQICAVIVHPDLVGPLTPVFIAHHVIYVQTEYPNCSACYHPVIGREIHLGEYCLNDRKATQCESHASFVPMLGNDGTAPCCAMTGCSHVTLGSAVCTCCQDGLIDGHAKAVLLEELFSERQLTPVDAATLV